MTGKGLLYDVKLKKNMEIKIKMKIILKKKSPQVGLYKENKELQ